MSTKKKFKWVAGAEILPSAYSALGNVKEVGFSKVADGILAEPAERKKARTNRLRRKLVPADQNILVEESTSGLSDKIEPSEASQIIRKDEKGIKGILRFGKGKKE